jgi:hypothetical protein
MFDFSSNVACSFLFNWEHVIFCLGTYSVYLSNCNERQQIHLGSRKQKQFELNLPEILNEIETVFIVFRRN